MINMRINRDCMQLDIHFHRAAMEIIEIEEVRSLDFPVKRHRSVLQALLRRKKTKKSKHRYVFILLLLVSCDKNRSLIMGKYITIQEKYIYFSFYLVALDHTFHLLIHYKLYCPLSFLPFKNHSLILLYFLTLEIL